jgi:hypothetical protein
MPRRLLERRYWLRQQERRQRLSPGIQSRWRVPGRPDFIDYWPDIPGTIPEKLIFEELVRLQVNFHFAWYFGDLKVTPDKRERYRPDFWLPDYNIIIEVAGVYWHTRPGKFEDDALRTFYLQAEGFKTYILTDQEVLRSPRLAIQSIPELNPPSIRGGSYTVGDRRHNPVASLVARLKKWPRRFQARWLKRAERSQGVQSRWKAGARPLRPVDPAGPLFGGLDENLVAQAIDYGKEYREWEAKYGR